MSTISCAKVVSVSASCSRCYSLTQSSLFPSLFIMFLYSCIPCCLSSYSYIQCSQIPVSVCFTTCYISLKLFSSLCLSRNLSSSLRSLHFVKHRRAHLARKVQQDKPMDETRQRYLSRNETCVVQTTGRQDEFKKNRQYRGIVRMTRISTDQRRSLNRQVRTNRHRNVRNTSTRSCSSQ